MSNYVPRSHVVAISKAVSEARPFLEKMIKALPDSKENKHLSHMLGGPRLEMWNMP
jgi:hypothetical protein